MDELERETVLKFFEERFEFYGLPFKEYEIREWDEDYARFSRSNGAEVEFSGLDPLGDDGIPLQYFMNISMDWEQYRKTH